MSGRFQPINRDTPCLRPFCAGLAAGKASGNDLRHCRIIIFGVEVRERSLSLADASDSFAKLVYDKRFRFLCSVPALEQVDESAISAAAILEFKKGVTVHFAGPAELLRVGLLINEPESASLFLRAVEGSLTRYNNQPSNRQAWRDIVRDIIS